MASFSAVPIVEVHNDNFTELWPTLVLAIRSSSFTAIDAELSGLGNRKLLNAKSVDTRYEEMCKVAKSRSIISWGISCFKLKTSAAPTESLNAFDFQVQSFNITLLCSENYVVEPLSLKFLIEHGFDFNKQYAKGIPYYRGQDKAGDSEERSVRRLFSELVQSKVPLVLHNGLVDLIFFYQNFYTDVPSSIQRFTADLNEMFVAGIFDTKYITEFKSRMPASYLEYVFRKSQRDNQASCEAGKRHVTLSFLDYSRNLVDVVVLPCGLDDQPQHSQVGKTRPCVQFSAHGWCPKGVSCPESHDIDCILDTEATKKKKRKSGKRKKQQETVTKDVTKSDEFPQMDTSFEESLKEPVEKTADDENDTHSMDSESLECDNEMKNSLPTENRSKHVDSTVTNVESTVTNSKSTSNDNITRRVGGHRAGYDSFMTGFAFACAVSKFGARPKEVKDTNGGVKISDFGLQDIVNRVALGGKDFPLLIQKSIYAKTSNLHKVKFEKLQQSSQS